MNRRDNFTRIIPKRISKLLDDISRLRNLDNTYYYEYSKEELEGIFKAIQDELDNTKDYLLKERKEFKL